MAGPRIVLVAGSTATAEIDGISAAGADPDLLAHTPSADAEILHYGAPVRAPEVPASPTGTLTPAVVSRALHERLDVDGTVVDGGLAEPTGAPTVTVGAQPGRDVREGDPVPSAPGAWAAARAFGRRLPDDELLLAETIPGGTTTALGVLRALGEPHGVASSLPENPLERKERVVAAGLDASAMEPGDAAGEPRRAVRRMGDPVLAVLAGVLEGAVASDTAVRLAGGTQMVAVAALARHAGVERTLPLATTTYVDADPGADLASAAAALDLDLTLTDPGFEASDHPAIAAYPHGEATEGVGMGGLLALADEAGVSMARIRDRVERLADDLGGDPA